MTQFDPGNIDPDTTSGTDLSESILEPWRDALHSCHKGSTRPSYAGQGMMWIDDSATPWLIKVYTGSTDCIIGSIAPSTGAFNVRSDVISEASSGAGVTVDGVLLKDGSVGSSGNPVTTVYADAVEIDGDSPLISPASSTDPGLSFDTWRTPNANRLTLVTVSAYCFTDGTTSGLIEWAVDESGGTSADYIGTIAEAHNAMGAGGRSWSTVTFPVLAGGSYRLPNTSDPNGANAIDEHREFVFRN